jgi:ubiquitin-like protein ATG12
LLTLALPRNAKQVKGSQTVAIISQFLRKTLRLQDRDPLFLYINSSFAPGLDQTIESLHACFKINDELVIH